LTIQIFAGECSARFVVRWYILFQLLPQFISEYNIERVSVTKLDPRFPKLP